MKRRELIDTAVLAERLSHDRDVVVLDVRDRNEFAEAHIPGSLHIPYGHLIERLAALPKDKAIATVCSGGKRSGLAVSLLQREGFESVVHVAHGGVRTWQQAGRPTESG